DNPIDSCWRGDSNWDQNRMKLADCAVGFGSSTMGGKGGDFYTVTSTDDNPVNPTPGTLRYGATREKALWIIFSQNMNIKLKMPLYVAGHKTIDGRGADVHLGNGGPCLFMRKVSHVILHSLHIHGCNTSVLGDVLVSESIGVEPVHAQDGDAITMRNVTNAWIDHNSLSDCSDGLIDVTLGSTGITISNNHFFNHHKVMLLGHDDTYDDDKSMKVTVAFNQFGPNAGQRMPRARYGLVHVANNNYDPWNIYAIGGSSNPTILSEGNSFTAPSESYKKEVTKRIGCESPSACANWVWRSTRDAFINGAYFVSSGKTEETNIYNSNEAFKVENGNAAPQLTKNAGVVT
nr:Chain A, Major pollen allergen Jun a 1 [Juniperus ashei]1PXZ_B Chain B, Major pollen allergen Jun a 1 [Juniperus ashei]